MDKWLNLNKVDKTLSPIPSTSGVSTPKKRKYDESYLEFGFTVCNNDGIQKPLCLTCNEVLRCRAISPSWQMK